MNKNIENKIKQIEISFNKIQIELSKPNIEREQRILMSKKLSIMEQIIDKNRIVIELEKNLSNTKNLLKEDLELELQQMAKSDIDDIEEKLNLEKNKLQK